jgi:hypothetical protein
MLVPSPWIISTHDADNSPLVSQVRNVTVSSHSSSRAFRAAVGLVRLRLHYLIAPTSPTSSNLLSSTIIVSIHRFHIHCVLRNNEVNVQHPVHLSKLFELLKWSRPPHSTYGRTMPSINDQSFSTERSDKENPRRKS